MQFIFAKSLRVGADVFRAMPGQAANVIVQAGDCTLVSQLAEDVTVAGAKRRISLFDGFLSVNAKLYHPFLTGSQVPPVSLGSLRHADSGIFVIGSMEIDSLGPVTASFFVDALSQYSVYYYCDPAGRYAVSNCINSLKGLLQDNGIPVSSAYLPSIYNIVFGGPIRPATHYDVIQQLPFGHYLRCGDGISLEKTDRVSLTGSYAEAYEFARGSMRRHFDAIKGALTKNHEVVLDVTGGTDTRTLLSFLTRKDMGVDFYGRCLTKYPNADGNVAAYIMKRYGISAGALPSQQVRHEAAIRSNAALFGGGRDVGGAQVLNASFRDLVHIRGMFGGISGASPGAGALERLSKSGDYTDARLLDHVVSSRDSLGVLSLVSKAAVDEVSGHYLELIRDLREKHGFEHMLSEYYLQTRSRSHFGHLGRVDNWTKIAPDPFCNAWLVEVRENMSSAMSANAKLNFDLIRGNDEELAFLPMANKVWNANVIPEGLEDMQRSMRKIDEKSEFLGGLEGDLMVRKHFPAPKIDYVLGPQLASGMNRGPHDVYISSFQTAAKFCVDEIGSGHAFWDYYDRNAIAEICIRAPEDFRGHGLEIQALGAFAAAGMSTLDLGIPPSITEAYDLNA